VEHLTIPELAALARFYAMPEGGASVCRKLVAFQTAATPALEADVVAWVPSGRRKWPTASFKPVRWRRDGRRSLPSRRARVRVALPVFGVFDRGGLPSPRQR
jgi:hypothetical protein